MIKKLFVGASALALTATAAEAQIVNPANPDPAAPVTINIDTNVPIQGGESTTFRESIRSATSSTAAAGARSGTSGAFDPPTPGQSGGWNGVGGYYNTQIQNDADVSDFTAAGNKAAIDTRGNQNEAIVDQTAGTAGWSAVRQQGNYNQANVEQDDAGGGGTANAASIQQVSANAGLTAFTQKAEINQVNVGLQGQHAAIVQGGVGTDGGAGAVGANNSARIDQYGGSNLAAYNRLNDASIVQAGSNNTAYLRQGRGANGSTVSSHAGIHQNGNGDAVVNQDLQSNGNVYVFQGAGNRLEADVIQSTGANNHVAINQNATSGAELTSFVSQTNGNGNSAFVNQSGTAVNIANAEVFQTGDANVALVQQSAAPVMNAQISQNGVGNYGAIYQ